VLGRDLAGGLDCGHAGVRHGAVAVEGVGRTLDIARARERGRVRCVLLGAPIEQVLADVEDEGRDRADRDEPAGEQDEDLAALAVTAFSC
jgi:hypothetical protein